MLSQDDHVLDRVDAYLHDVLPSADAQRVEKHCAACPICQVALDEARKRLSALDTLPVVEASDELIRATEQRVRRYRRRKFTVGRVVFGVAASIAMVLVGFHVYYATLSPSPYDLRVLGQSELLAGSEASLRVLLVNPASGKAIAGVPVEIELAEKDPRSASTWPASPPTKAAAARRGCGCRIGKAATTSSACGPCRAARKSRSSRRSSSSGPGSSCSPATSRSISRAR